MSDTAQDRIDLDTLTDDEVMNLDPTQVQALMDAEASGGNEGSDQEEDANAEIVSEENLSEDDSNTDDPNDAASGSNGPDEPEVDENTTTDTETPEGQPVLDEDKPKDPPAKKSDAKSETKKPDGEAKDPKAVPDPDKKPEEEKEQKDLKDQKDAKPKADEKPAVDTNLATDFFKKVTAPFKADGRDMQVRSAEDAIRLMQMGVNYSRRMQEMKPLKAQDQTLKNNGLDTPEKINFMIDVAKGKPEAIRQLLKDHNIDPLDVDTSGDAPAYKAQDYRPDPKDQAFKDAIENTLAQEGGRELIVDVNSQWDDQSKEALRDQPVIFENLLAQKASGVYGKVNDEVRYQRSLGFLTDVPFLQAYHQVSVAMQKAGAIPSDQQVQSGGPAPVVPQNPAPVAAPVQAQQPAAPIDTGPRKAAPKPKTEQPNPNLSSTTQPRSTPSNGGGGQQEPDYSSMSDEDFLKLGAPS